MSGARNRRFPRTAGAVPEAAPPQAAPKIEREKIRHRRPNDLMFDAGEPAPTRQTSLQDQADDVVFTVGGDAYVEESAMEESYADEADLDWTKQQDDDDDVSDWDYEPEDDWVLDGDDGPASAGYEETAVDDGEEESGVVWEDDAYDDGITDDDPDELTFGQASEDVALGPEVELAGRRDVRPKPPRAAAPPRARAPRPQAPRQRQPEPVAPPERRSNFQDEEALAPPPGGGGFARRGDQQRPPPGARGNPQPADNGRFSRTRATLGAADDGSDMQVLEQPRRGSTPRRRQAHPQAHAKAAAPRTAGRYSPLPRHGGARGKGLIKIAALLLVLIGGGWFAYQAVGSEGVQPMIDRVTSLLPGAGRTADDTSFGGQADTVSPEQAISDLEQRLRQQDDDAATAPIDGPPIPKFKPLPGATRSLSAGSGTSAADPPQLAANQGEDDAGEPSIFEQLWRYLSPG